MKKRQKKKAQATAIVMPLEKNLKWINRLAKFLCSANHDTHEEQSKKVADSDQQNLTDFDLCDLSQETNLWNPHLPSV